MVFNNVPVSLKLFLPLSKFIFGLVVSLEFGNELIESFIESFLNRQFGLQEQAVG